MKKSKIFIISGPSGSGKTTLHKKILSDPLFRNKLAKTTSVTTRAPRHGERQGRDYFFVTRPMFLCKKKAGHFLESQKVFDHYYGTPLSQVRDLRRSGRHVLLCIDVKGARVISRRFPEAVKIFIKTPSLRVLKERLKTRGVDSPMTMRIRLQTAKEELKESVRYNYVITNDHLQSAYHLLREIIKKEIRGEGFSGSPFEH